MEPGPPPRGRGAQAAAGGGRPRRRGRLRSVGVKRRLHTPSSRVPSFPSSPSPSDVWSWQLGRFRIPDPSPPPRGRYIAGADATRPAARHSLREGRSAAATGGAGGGGRCSGGGAGAAAAPGPGQAWAPGGAPRPGGSGAERARRLQPGPGPGGAASARSFCTVGARARAGGRLAGPGGAGRGAARAPGTAAPARAEREEPQPSPAGRLPQPREPDLSPRRALQPGPSREAPGSPRLPFGSCPGTGGSVRSLGSRGAPSFSLPRSPPLSVCREVLSSGGGEGGLQDGLALAQGAALPIGIQGMGLWPDHVCLGQMCSAHGDFVAELHLQSFSWPMAFLKKTPGWLSHLVCVSVLGVVLLTPASHQGPELA
ncbi:hypothetical protein H8959_016144 [Pygathrix nigripes]